MDCLPHIHVTAIHSEAGYHTSVPGLGVFCRNHNLVLGVGQYANSEKTKERRTSTYALVGYQPFRIGPVKIGAVAGVVTGYSRGTMPMAAGLVSYPVSWGEIHLTVIPPVKNITPAVAQISFTVRFP